MTLWTGRERPPTNLANAQAIEHLKNSLAQGKDWIKSLLESMSLWTLPEETFRKRRNKYPPGR